ncbi:MAG: hypothetical protein ACRDI2_25055, partial [Chloroflexota bacterium]
YMVVAQKGVTWLVPGSDIGVLNGLAGRFLMVTAVAIGALLWPALAVAPGRLQRGILLAALAYTGPLAVYGGYWDYYVLEPTILLFMYLLTHWLRIDEPDAPATGRWSIAASYVYGCALALAVAALGASVAGSLLGERVIWVGVAVGMLGAGLAYALTRVRPHVRPDGPNRALPSAALALYVATSWYTQRVDIDALHAHTLIMEQAFRSGWAAPGDAGATFGHTAWSAFRYQMEKGSAEARGDPEAALIAWKGMIASSGQWGFTPSVRLHWGSRTDGTPRTAGSGYATIAQGSATVGLVPRRWMLVQVDTPSQAERPTYPHRFLPLTRQEWRLLLHGGGPQSGSPVSGRIELHVTNQQLMAT